MPKREFITYDNGLKHVHYHVPFMKSVLLDFYVGFGSGDEITPDQYGIAHFLEHMLFNGSEKYPVRADTDNLVSSLGNYQNAWTWLSMTTYYQYSTKENFKQAFDILSDRVFNPILREEDVQKEIGVIQEERLMCENDPWISLVLELESRLFAPTPLSHPTIGTESSIGGMTSVALKEFHQNGYHPHNVWFVTYGGMSLNEISAIVSSTFKEIGGSVRYDHQSIVLPTVSGESGVEIKKDIDLSIYMIYLSLPPVKTIEELAALSVFETLLGSGNGSRFVDEFMLKKSLASAVEFDIYTHRNGVMMGTSLNCEPKDLETAKKLTRKYLVDLDFSFGSDDVDRASKFTHGNLIRSIEEVGFLSSSGLQNLELMNFLNGSDHDLDMLQEAIRSVGVREIKKLINWIGDNASWIDGVAVPN